MLKWFRGHPALVEWKDDFADFVDHLERLAKARHTLAHGILHAINYRTRMATFKSVSRKKGGGLQVHQKDIPIDLFPRMAYRANAANAFLSALTHKLCCPNGEEIMRWRPPSEEGDLPSSG